MRFARTCVAVLVSLVFSASALPQQKPAPTPSSSPQAVALLQKSLAALTGGQSVTDITLSGTARRIAGSDDESGVASIKAISAGASQVELTLPSGLRTEIRNSTTTAPTGSWSGPDKQPHAMPQHNLLVEPAWFFPAFVVALGRSGPNYAATYIGHESLDSRDVEHILIYKQLSSSPSGVSAIVQHLSRQDIYLDSSTYLPVAMTFDTHPDQLTTADIPICVRFSDYRVVNGAHVPFRVQKYMNNGLILELQFGAVALNTGLSASSFTVE